MKFLLFDPGPDPQVGIDLMNFRRYGCTFRRKLKVEVGGVYRLKNGWFTEPLILNKDPAEDVFIFECPESRITFTARGTVYLTVSCPYDIIERIS